MAGNVKYKYRAITDLSDSEIEALCEEIFHPEYISDIERGDDEVCVTIGTRWGEKSELMEDVIVLTDSEYDADWSIRPEDIWQYRQYLFALGVTPLAHDNPYL